MSDDNAVGRRRVLQVTAGLFGGALSVGGSSAAESAQVRAQGAADGDPVELPDVTDVTFYDLDRSGLELPEVDVPGGETVSPVATIGNGAFEADGSDGLAFYGVPDSGPAIDCDAASSIAGRPGQSFCGQTLSGEIRPVPEFAPAVYRLELEDGSFRLRDRIELSDAEGEAVSTLTNPVSNGTTPVFSLEGEQLPYDPNGLDLEGLVRTSNGTFWFGDEYAPSIVEVAPDGEVLSRHVPPGIDDDLADATYPVEGTLPEVFARREGGRGIESIGLSPDESTLYFSLQSPLANPDAAAHESSRNVRIGTFDPEAEQVTEQYCYRLDEPDTFRADAAAGDVTQSDVKVSELSVLEEDRLLVLERISQTTKFYVVDCSAANPIPDRYDDPSTRPTLAQVDPATDDALDPLEKELLFTTDDHDGFTTKLEGIARPSADELLVVNDSDWELDGGETSVAHVRFDGPLSGEHQHQPEEFVTTETTAEGAGPTPTLEPIGRFSTGAAFDEAGAEIPTFDPTTDRVFVVNGAESVVEVVDVSDPTSPTAAGTVDATTAFDSAADVTSVAVEDGVLATAVVAEDSQNPGAVAFYDAASLAELAVVEVGALPDAVTFSPDGQTVLAANEGEPTSDYERDPAGSISVIDVAAGVDSATVQTADFSDYVGREAELRERGVRIYGPGSDAAQDFEPEYVAVAPDGDTAYATLQENNAIAVVDVPTAEVTDVVPLGYKDFSEPGNELDAVDDGEIDLRNWPIYGMYQPDAIEAYEVDGETHLVVADEGDAREYDAIWETGVLVESDGVYGLDATEDDGTNVDVPIDESAFEDDVLDELLGLEVTTELGDVDEDGALEELYVFGGRSFSVLDEDAQRVSQSGSEFERIVADAVPEFFNTDNDENDMDGGSVASGPEPEGVALGELAGSPYAFVGLEGVGGLATYDVRDPSDPQFVQYLNTRDFSVDPEDIEESLEDDDPSTDLPADAADDLGPEGLTFVPAGESPIGEPLVVVGHEVSGTLTVYRIETSVLGADSVALRHGATGTVDLSLLSAMDGFSGGRLTVSVADPAVASITDANVDDAFLESASIESSGSELSLSLVDLEESIQPGATEVSLATIEVEGTATGTTDLAIEVEAFDDDAGSPVDVATRDGLVITGPQPVEGGRDAPTDPDGDGRYQDLNGNGRLDYDDVVLLFEQIESDAVRLNRDAFDFNDNGEIDYDDVVQLYQQL